MTISTKLKDKYNLYLKLIKIQQDHYGFVESKDCDSLLFTGLVGCVLGVDVVISAAFDPNDHQWKRRPIECPCWPNSSGSSISRDQLLGLAWYAYYNNRLDISEQVIQYALSHCLIMGRGVISRTFLTPGLLSTYAWISYKLGGPSRWWLRYLPQFESIRVTDYEAHLSVLHILLRNELTGKKKYQNVLDYQADRNTENALFQFAAGNIDKVYTILNNEDYFPPGRLPNVSDRKSHWLWERDNDDNYKPGSGFKIHSGGDYLFLYWLMTK